MVSVLQEHRKTLAAEAPNWGRVACNLHRENPPGLRLTTTLGFFPENTIMTRCISWVTVPCMALLALTAQAGPPKLDLNDVTWLWPVPKSSEDLDGIIAIDSLATADGSPVWSDEQFEDVLKTADGDAAKVGEHRIQLPDSVRTKQVWRIAAFRVDPTAPGGHEVIRKNFGEKPQLRLILQPVTVVDGRVAVHDIAVHLVYSFLRKHGESAELPDREHFKIIISDLDAMKKVIEDAGVKTSGVPLGVHPGLKADVPGLDAMVKAFLAKHLRASDLNAMAIMGLDGPEPWIFVAMGKFPPGAERFGPIPFLPAQMISFRSGDGIVSPPPKVNNRNPVPNKVTMPDQAKDRRGVATAAMFGDADFELNAFAVIGKNENGEAVLDDQVRNRDIPDLIADPIRSHFFNTDCVSCHTETRRRLRFSLTAGEFAFRQDGKPPLIDPDVLPKDDWNVRNLGWFPPSEFIGGGPTVPTVTQRTANETAEVVEFIERNYRQDESPSDSDSAADSESAEVSEQLIGSSDGPIYLDQGWTEEERQEFYYRGQGSQLIPYVWFLNLEVSTNNELFRSDRHMVSLGCITQGASDPRNPDGLPIGFVKDDNPSTVGMRRGFLGAAADASHAKPSNSWLGLTCAACHTTDLRHNEKTVRIDGGAAMIDVESFLDALAASMRRTADDDEKFSSFEKRIRNSVEGDIDTTGLRDELLLYTKSIEELVERNKAKHTYGWGRLDAFGAILNQICEANLGIPENRRPASAPVSYPFVWDATRLDWVQWNSSSDIPITRNVGEVLGVFAHVDLMGASADEKFTSSVRVDFLHRLEQILSKLRAPAWPEEHFGEINAEKVQAGKQLFADNCARCHNTRDENGDYRMTDPNMMGARFIKTTSVPFLEIGTDPQMVLNFITRTAKPGTLTPDIQIDLADPRTQAQFERLTRLFENLNLPKPDLLVEVPAALLLKAAVRGTIKRQLDTELARLSEDERRAILIELNGHREVGNTPPNGGAGYKARPLNGVWATAPFGHAGAVPNLYQWLLPEEQRVKSFYVGSGEFDPKHVGFSAEATEGAFHFRTETEEGVAIPGNSNKGHSGPGHTDFTDEERWQIIEYIKTLK